MTWLLNTDQVLIVGGHDAYEGEAAFSRCTVVLRRADVPTRLLAIRYQGSEAQGAEVDEREWRGLLDSGDALELPAPVTAFPGAALWLLRPSLTAQAERARTLREAGAAVMPGPGGVLVAVVNEDKLGHLRELWAHESGNRACTLAADGAMSSAVAEAEQRFVLTRSLQVQPVALLAALYRLAGHRLDGDAMLEMAQRSRGEIFARDARKQAEDYERTLPRARPEAPHQPGRARQLEPRRRSIGLSKDGLRDRAASA